MHSCMTEMVCQISMVKVYYLEGCSHPSGYCVKGVVSHPWCPCRLGFHQEKNLVASWHPPPEPGASTESPAGRSKTCQWGIGRKAGMEEEKTEKSGEWVSDEEMEIWNATAVSLSHAQHSALPHMRVQEGVCECALIAWMLQQRLLPSPGLFMQWWERVREKKKEGVC